MLLRRRSTICLIVRRRPLLRGACVGASLLLVASAGAAGPKRITGKLSRGGYTVIALDSSGKASSIRVRGRSFSIVPPASVVTLHLRGPTGRYAGPVVVGTKGRLAVVGVRAGAKLGTVSVRAGYARVAKKLPKRFLDTRRVARANKGIPIGARVFGRVRVAGVSASAQAPGLDADLDGIPNALDIDDDGDLLLDNFDRSAALRYAQTGDAVHLNSGLVLHMQDTANIHAGPLSAAEVDSVLATWGTLHLRINPGESVELDCGGLPYCSPGGTGRAAYSPGEPEFPECCDSDADGFGTLTAPPGVFPGDFFLRHGATTSEIRTGDVLIERVTTAGVESQFPATLQSVFATVPALAAYSDGQGNAATVSYPAAPPGTPGGGGLGTHGNGFPVTTGVGGEVVVALTFWRPQRGPIPPETAEWTDIGRLTYLASVGCVPELPGPQRCAEKACPQDAFTTTQTGWTPSTLPSYRGGGLSDPAPDASADPANTFTYSLNLSRCLTANGLTWVPGQQYEFNLTGTNESDFAQQKVFFKRQ